MKRSRISTGLLILVAVVVFAGGSEEQRDANYELSEWEIPFLNVLTGPIASIGDYLLWGAERAAEEINADGGIDGVPIRIRAIDTGMDPNEGVVQMSRLVESDAIAALGPVPEPVILAAMPIAVESGFFSMTATTSYEYAERFFPWSISWFGSTAATLPPAVRGWVRENPDLRRVVQIVENYGPWPGMADAHDIGLEAEGVEVIDRIETAQDVVTFGPIIVRALEQNPDGIIFAANSEKVARMIIELRNRGWDRPEHLLIFNSADDVPLYTTGGDALNGVMIYNYVNSEYESPRWNAFRDAYAADHGGLAPPSLSTHYYDAVYMLAEAIEATGATGAPSRLTEERRAVAEYCANVDNFEGILFTWSMSDGVPTDKPLYLFEIRDGSKRLVREIRPDDF